MATQSQHVNHPRRYALVNLGCPKNEVDGEGMCRVLSTAGLEGSADTDDADVVIVNTCGFIKPAVDESHRVIEDLERRKRPSQTLIVAGCLSERLGEELAREHPQVDGLLGTLRWAEIDRLVDRLTREKSLHWLGSARIEVNPDRSYLGPSAYVKISDGCDAKCAFCTIPSFKGLHRSKSPEAILSEVRQLGDLGVREVVLIGQDTTSYGRDLGLSDGLATLLGRMCDENPDLPWIRLMYAFPGHLSARILEVIAARDQIVNYVDIPLQHANRDMLARMRRPRVDLRAMVERIRGAVPDVAIRSTFIVGFPGETDAEFDDLLSFLRDAQLDRVGVFKYSAEPGTPAGEMPDQVPEPVKEARYRAAMVAQQQISLKRNQRLVGQDLSVLVESVEERNGHHERSRRLVGRSYRDAPEVDGQVIVRGDASVGDVVRVRVTSAAEYDLRGRLV